MPRVIRWLTGRLVAGVAAAVLLGAAVMVIRYDLATSVPFDDEPVYVWQTAALLHGRGLVSFPGFVPIALTHRVIGLLGTLGHPDPGLLRLTVLPFMLAAAWAAFRLTRRLGGDVAWAWIASVVLASDPIVLALTTTFMTDVVYVGLLMIAVLTSVRWLEDDRGRTATVAAVLLSVGERQTGLAIAGALSVAFWWRSRQGHALARRDWVALGAIWAGCLAIVWLAVMAGAAPDQSVRTGIVASVTTEARQLIDWTLFAPGMVGFVMLPFLAVLALRAWHLGWRGDARAAAAGAALVAMVGAVALIALGNGIPGDYLNQYGLGPADVSQYGAAVLRVAHPAASIAKPRLIWPLAQFFLSIACVGTSCLLVFTTLRRARTRPAINPTAVFLVLLTAGQVVLLALVGHFDRYYVAVIAPLLPVAAWRASTWFGPRLAASALPAVLVGLLIYGVGQQDYEAWQVARDAAAKDARAQVGAEHVDAGWESNLQYYLIPAYDRTGTVLPWPCCALHLELAPPHDPRPGRDYKSLASGRIVIARGPSQRLP